MASSRRLLRVWERMHPVTAYVQGGKTAGKYFVHSEENIIEAVKELDAIKPTTEAERKILRSLRAEILFEEPRFAVQSAVSAIYAYIVRKATRKQTAALCKQIAEAMCVSRIRLVQRDWPAERRMQTTAACNAFDMLLEEVNLPKGEKERLQQENELYRRAFYMPGVTNGSFEDVYPLLRRHARRTKRSGYAQLLRELYDYPETAAVMERMAAGWLEKELVLFHAVKKRLAGLYGCRSDRVALYNEVVRRWKVSDKNIIRMVSQLNRAIRPVMEQYLIDVPGQHSTTIIKTPSYLAVFLPSAAVQPFNTLTPKPFNMYFVTPNPKSNLVDIMQTLVHEEYGHCVHYTLSTLHAKDAALRLETTLHGPITEGLSFQRELEFVMLSSYDRDVRKALAKVVGSKRVEEFLLAVEFQTRKWRLVRFLRALYDIRTNTGKMSVYEFMEWAHRRTGVDRETIFNQTFRIGVPTGYLLGYSMFGMKLWKLQRRLRRKTVKEFNTFAASAGFPGQTILLEKLEKFVE